MKLLKHTFSLSKSSVGPIFLIAAVYLLTICSFERRGFWNVDNANKFLQVQAITQSNFADYSIDWPGKTIDPDFAFNPMPRPFSYIKDGKMFSPYSAAFATVSAVLFRLGGFWGLYILPAVCSLLMLLACGKIARRLDSKGPVEQAAIFITGLCTPIWFYSVTFWEHTAGLCLCVWGVYFYLKFLKTAAAKDIIFGSVLAALSIYFRSEHTLFCVVLVIVTLSYTPGRKLKTASLAVGSMIAALMPLWLFQWAVLGEPFGFHAISQLATVASPAKFISTRPVVSYNLFVTSGPNRWLSVATAAPFIIAFLFNRQYSKRGFVLAVPLYSLAAVVSATFVLKSHFTAASPIFWMFRSCSLFTAAPVVMLAFLRLKDSDQKSTTRSEAKWIWVVALAYAVFYTLAAPQESSIGIHWGNRFLLVLYPLFAVLAAVNLVRWFEYVKHEISWQKLVTALLIMAGMVGQLYSINILQKKKAFSYRANQQIQKYTEPVVISDLWWVCQELHSDFYNKPFFRASSFRRLDKLQQLLRDSGYNKAIFVTQMPEFPEGIQVGQVDDEGLNFFTLNFFSITY